MARIEIRRYDLFTKGHLYYELIDDNGQRIAQINGFGSDPVTGETYPIAPDGYPTGIYSDRILKGVFGDTTNIADNPGTVIFSGTQADVMKALAYIQDFEDYINANGQYLPYKSLPGDNKGFFNSNSGANTVGEILSVAVPIDHSALDTFRNPDSNPGVEDDLLRGETWSPNVNGSTIIGSHVLGTSGIDKMNYGQGTNILTGFNGNDVFSFGSVPHGSKVTNGNNTVYGGSETNKVLSDTSDGMDTYLVNKDWTVVAFNDHWEVTAPNNGAFKDTLYSIEQVSAQTYDPKNRHDFHNLNGGLILQEASPTRLASLGETEGVILKTAVDVTYGSQTFSLGNFGVFIGTQYTDIANINAQGTQITYDGGLGVDKFYVSSFSNASLSIDQRLGFGSLGHFEAIGATSGAAVADGSVKGFEQFGGRAMIHEAGVTGLTTLSDTTVVDYSSSTQGLNFGGTGTYANGITVRSSAAPGVVDTMSPSNGGAQSGVTQLIGSSNSNYFSLGSVNRTMTILDGKSNDRADLSFFNTLNYRFSGGQDTINAFCNIKGGVLYMPYLASAAGVTVTAVDVGDTTFNGKPADIVNLQVQSGTDRLTFASLDLSYTAGATKYDPLTNQMAFGKMVFGDGTVWDLTQITVYKDGHVTIPTGTAQTYDVSEGTNANETFTLRGNDTELHGMGGDDALTGLASNDKLYGELGNDTLTGMDGDDRLYGAEGNDILKGGNGNDLLAGGSGNDSMDGGAGNDTYFFDGGQDTITDASGNDRLEFAACCLDFVTNATRANFQNTACFQV